ncbi:MAG: sugar phosphate nucleotidyltransferase [Fidelibacterota bacterium]
MKVIIPVAGRGTRLLPHTRKRQKCLLPVAGRPVIDHILEPLIEQGFDRIVLITGYLQEQLEDYVKKFDAHFSFVLQPEALGLGHAVFLGLENSDDPVMIQLGDVIYHLEFAEFCNSRDHRIAVDTVPDPERFGIVEVDGDRIVAVHEKPENPPTNLAIVGLYYLFSEKALRDAIGYLMDEKITTKGEMQLADAFQRMIDQGDIITRKAVPQWYDCGIPDTFLATNRLLLRPSGVSVKGCRIIEPVSIGEDCVIVDSTIGPHVTVMDGCRISHSKVSDAIVLWNACLEDVTVSHRIVEEDGRLF